MGPTPFSQDRTCVSGQTCILDGIVGRSIATSDHLLMLDTCGSGGIVPRLPDWSWSVELADAGPGLVQLEASAAGIVSAAGGQYRMCWCADASIFACSSLENFRVDLGALTIVGVSPLSQDRTCVSGQTCWIDGLTGQHLTPDDKLRA